MISGYISNKCIAQERLENAQKQFDTQTSKVKSMEDPLDYIVVKIQTPNFPQLLEIDRNLFCDNFNQTLREIPPFRAIPELTPEHTRKIIDLVNSYKVSLGLDKILCAEEDNIGEENKNKFQIKDSHNVSTMPTNPYANLGIANKGTAQGLLNQYVAGNYFKNTGESQKMDYFKGPGETQKDYFKTVDSPSNNYFKSGDQMKDYEQSNKNNLIRTFRQKTNENEEIAKFYLDSTNYNLQSALELYNTK